MPDLSLLWRKHRHIAPPGTLGVATSSYNSGKCDVKGTQATYCALIFVAPPVSPFCGLFDSFDFLSGEDSGEIKVPETDRRRLEKQLEHEHDHGDRVQPVWLSGEIDSEGVAHFVVGQLQRFGAPDAYALISTVVIWGSKALHVYLSGSRNTRPSLAYLPAATTLPAVRRPTSVAHSLRHPQHNTTRLPPPVFAARSHSLPRAHHCRRSPYGLSPVTPRPHSVTAAVINSWLTIGVTAGRAAGPRRRVGC